MKGSWGWGVGGRAAEVTWQEKSLFYVHLHDMYVCTHTYTHTNIYTDAHTNKKTKENKNVLNREKKQEVSQTHSGIQWHWPHSQRKVPRACEGGHGLPGFPPCQSPLVHLLHRPPGMTTCFNVWPHQINIPCHDHMFSKSDNTNSATTKTPSSTTCYNMFLYLIVENQVSPSTTFYKNMFLLSDHRKPTFFINYLLQQNV